MMTINKIAFISILIASCITITGCSANSIIDTPAKKETEKTSDSKKQKSKNKKHSKKNRQQIKMSDDEITFMRNSVVLDKEAVADGYLDPDEEDILWEYRAGEEYLKQKYPDIDIAIINFDGKTSAKKYNTYYIDDHKGNRYYEMRICKNGETGFTITDNYYAELIHDEAEDEIAFMIATNGYPKPEVEVSFHTCFGMADETPSVYDLLQGESDTDNTIKIILNPDDIKEIDYDKTAEGIKKILKNEDFVGYVTVIIGSKDRMHDKYVKSFGL